MRRKLSRGKAIVFAIAFADLLLWFYASSILKNIFLTWIALFILDLIFFSRVAYYVKKGILLRVPNQRKLLKFLLRRYAQTAATLLNLNVLELIGKFKNQNMRWLSAAILIPLILIGSYLSNPRQTKGPRESFYAERSHLSSNSTDI
jgi:cation transport ATPase